MAALLIIIPDRLSQIVAKGEVVARYYNPGDLFDEVHILMTNDDDVRPEQVQKLVGRARVFLYNLPITKGLLLQPGRFSAWADQAVKIAKTVRPPVVRCYADEYNVLLARRIRDQLDIPYIVSVHTNPDEAISLGRGWRHRLLCAVKERLKRRPLREADLVLVVYRGIIPYVQRLGVTRFDVVYNVLDGDHLLSKTDYALHHPVRILSVGRQIPGKNPVNVIRAVARLPGVHLTLVGDGPLHDELRVAAMACGVEDRVTFVRSMANERLCAAMSDYDFFAAHTDFMEIPKAVMEPLLVGLPVVINRRRGQPVPELQGDYVFMVDDSVEGYEGAFRKLIGDDRFRESLGQKGFKHARTHWAPERMEARLVEIYRRYL